MSVKPTGMVRVRLDPRNPPRLSAKQRARLDAITDGKIDLTEMPEMGNVAWTRPGSLVPAENKEQITLRIDADVVNYFRGTGRRYQTRINQVLRAFVDAQQSGQAPLVQRKRLV